MADTFNHSLQRFDTTCRLINQWKLRNSDGVIQLYGPLGICIGDKGYIYTTDISNHTVQVFNTEGKPVKKFGKKGEGPGQFYYPAGIASDNKGFIYVTDFNNRVQKFTSQGKFLTQFGTKGSEEGEFECPEGIALDKEGNVYVVDKTNNRIQKFMAVKKKESEQ